MGYRTRFPRGGVAIFAVSLLLSGCSIPLPLTLAMDGVLYMASGKTLSDHFISGLMQKDCSVSRAVISQNDLCMIQQNQTLVSADLDEGEQFDIETASGKAEQ